MGSKSDFHFPPGFRFYPSDEELIVHYLKNKVTSSPLPASIIAEIDLYKYNPWELSNKALFGEDEWYFFTPRDRKYPNGARPNRAAVSGYWKATGTDKPILCSSGPRIIGVKKALVFYKGRPPKGIKTDWIMHEYRLLDSAVWNSPKRKGSMRLDDWVLCRVRQKSNILRSSWEYRNGSSNEPAGDLIPKANDLLQMNGDDPNVEMVKSYLFNEYPMLPYIFASQVLPFMKETSSSISFQSSDKTCNSIFEESPEHDENFQISVTSLPNLLHPPKKKLQERNQEENCVHLSKKLTKGDTEEEAVITSISENGADMDLCGTDHSGDSTFSPAQWNSLTQYQELDHLDFI